MKPNKYIVWGMTKSTLIHIFLMSVAVTCLFPLFWMVRCAFMTNETVFVMSRLFKGSPLPHLQRRTPLGSGQMPSLWQSLFDR